MSEVATIEYGADREENLPSVLDRRDSDMPLVEFLHNALTNPDIDAAKVALLLGAYEKREDDWRRRRYNEAFFALQGELKRIQKNKTNPDTHSAFADTEIIDRQLHPLCQMHGFTVSYDPVEGPNETRVYMRALVAHKDGYERIYGPISIPYDNTGPKGAQNKTMTHGAGSAYTYAQRYLAARIFNLRFGKDDDGNEASSRSADARQDERRTGNGPMREYVRSEDFNRPKQEKGRTQGQNKPPVEETWIASVERRISEAADNPSRLDVVGKAALEIKSEDDITLMRRSPPIKELAKLPDNLPRIQAFLAAARLRISRQTERPSTQQQARAVASGPFWAEVEDPGTGDLLGGPFDNEVEFAQFFVDTWEPRKDAQAFARHHAKALMLARKNPDAKRILEPVA
jgi:hypothetical protein